LKWQKEMEIAARIMDLRKEIQEAHQKDPSNGAILSQKREQLKAMEPELAAVQGDMPLVQIAVDSPTICEVISGWTGIPTGRMLTKPAFLGRLVVVPYYPIGDKNMRLIVKLKLDRIAKRMRENRNVSFLYSEDLIESIASRCTEVDSGARNVDHILSNTLLPEMSNELLSRMARGEQIKEVSVSLIDGGFAFDIR